MKSRMLQTILTLVSCMFIGGQALAWNCPSGQIRQQAPAGTPTSTPNYDVVEGIAFICVPSTPPVTPSIGSNTNTNQNSNTNGNSNTNNNMNTSNSSSTATNNTRVSNNLKLNNTLTNKQNQSQKQQQGQEQTATGGDASSTATATGNGVGNGNGSNNTTTNVEAAKIPVNTAYAPTAVPTAPCQQGMGGGVQTGLFGGSFGGNKTNKVCEGLEIARSFAIAGSRIAYCKQMIATAKRADKASTITMEDCMYVPAPPAQAVIVQQPPAPVAAPPVVPLAVPSAPVAVIAPVVIKKKVVKHQAPPCQNQLVMRCVLNKPKGEK